MSTPRRIPLSTCFSKKEVGPPECYETSAGGDIDEEEINGQEVDVGYPTSGEFEDSTQFQIDSVTGLYPPPADQDYKWENGYAVRPVPGQGNGYSIRPVAYTEVISDIDNLQSDAVDVFDGAVNTLPVVNVRLLPYHVSYPFPKTALLMMYPNSLLAETIRSNPGIENIDITEKFVDPTTMSYLYDTVLNKPSPRPTYNDLDRIGRYLRIPL